MRRARSGSGTIRPASSRTACPNDCAPLTAGVRAGDVRDLAALDRAVAELMPTAPCAGADLATRALDLTAPDDSAHNARVLTAVRALSYAGRLDEADELARSALGRPMPA